MFKYTTVLKYMLNDPKYRLFIGDATVVFWAEKTGIYEDLLAELFNPSNEEASNEEASKEISEKDVKTRDLARDILQRYSMGLNLRKDAYDLDQIQCSYPWYFTQ